MIENEINVQGKFSMRINFNLKGIGGARSQIWLKTTIDKQRVNIYTKMLIEPQFWLRTTRTQIGEKAIIDSRYGNPQNCYNRKVNERLQKILDYCKEYAVLVTQEDLQGRVKLKHNRENFIDFIKSRIEGSDASFERNPCAFIEDYIERKKNDINNGTMKKVSSGTIRNHQFALKRLRQFCSEVHRNLTWDIFNSRFEIDFRSWMNTKKYSANTEAAQFSCIKQWLTQAEEEDFLADKSYKKFRTKCIDVENIYLTEDEIKRIYNIDFSSEEIKSLIGNRKQIEQTRDLFVFACCTGLRFSDYHDLSSVEIIHDNLKVTTQKTSEPVYIPISPMASEILNKYHGRLPTAVTKSTSLNHVKLCAKIAGIDDLISKTSIKGGESIRKVEPKYEFVMNHTARRSFATNLVKRGVPILSIMAITGHRTVENFLKYVKLTKEEHAEIVRKFMNEKQ